ncbi:MAG TPA: hypothetical protein PKC98_15460 [Candidatus Melainabacteria bacterium]|nr:hypothetical protein [Candidatus Melainabacteria bacterium]
MKVQNGFSVFSIGAVVVLSAGILGAAYKQVPTEFLIPVSFTSFLRSVVQIMTQSIFGYYFMAPGILFFSLLAIYGLKSERKLPSQFWVLLMPLVADLPILLWTGYYSIYPQKDFGMIDSWASGVTLSLTSVYFLIFFSVLIYIVFSNTWKNVRLFALSILSIEFLISAGIILTAFWTFT